MKIAILSNGNANYSTKRLVEEAEKRGHKVRVNKYKNCFLSLDEKHPEVYYRGKPLKKFDAIIPRISNNMTRYGCAIVRQFEMQGTWTVSSSIAITRANRFSLKLVLTLLKPSLAVILRILTIFSSGLGYQSSLNSLQAPTVMV